MSKTKTIGNFELKEGTLTASCEELQIREEYPVVLVHEKEKRFLNGDCILSYHTLDDFSTEDDIKSIVEEELCEVIRQESDIIHWSEAAQSLAQMDIKELLSCEEATTGRHRFAILLFRYMRHNQYTTLESVLKDPPENIRAYKGFGDAKFTNLLHFLKIKGLEPTDCGEWGRLVAELRD